MAPVESHELSDDAPPPDPDTLDPDAFDPGTYGRSFADVYDSWYPDDPETALTVGLLVDLSPEGGSALELGVGTGRLALPLSRSGLTVTGMDASPEMLEQLTGKDPAAAVRQVLGDVGRPDDWPDGPFDLVLAANNLLCNLADEVSQQQCVTTAAGHLAPGGHLVVEAVVPGPLLGGRQVTRSRVPSDAQVTITTDCDPATGVVLAQHMEVRDGHPTRVRPWRIRIPTPEEIDAWAWAAGLVRTRRLSGWDGTPYVPPEQSCIAVYSRPTVCPDV